MRYTPHSSSLARPRPPAGVMSRAATVAMVMPLVVLLLALATPASALELQDMEETLKSHTHTLAKMTKYLRMTDKFWNWFRNNRVLLDELLNAGVQTRDLDSPQLHELSVKILDVETKLEESRTEVTTRLELDLIRLEQELVTERNNSRVLKQALEESKQKNEELEEKVMNIDRMSKNSISFVSFNIKKVNDDLQNMKAVVQEVKDKQSELDVVVNKVEDHERRISEWEAEGNFTKSGWAKALVREMDDRVAPLRLALDCLNDTLTNDTAKKVEAHERRISHWEAEGNVTKSGWAGALVREMDNRLAPLHFALDRLNDTTASLGNATTKAKEDIQKMEQERELDRDYVRILEEALEGTSVEMDRLATDLDQRVMDLLLPMNETILLVGHAVWALQNTTEDIRQNLTERLEEVERNVKYKGSTSSAKTSHFQGQLNALRDATRGMAANITSLESQLESVRDSEAQLRKDVQALQQQAGQVDLDLSALEAKVGSAANLTARVKSLEKRMAMRDSTFTTGNKLLSSLTNGGSMLNAPGGKAPVSFLKNPGQIGFPMGFGPSSPAGVAPSHVAPSHVAPSHVAPSHVTPPGGAVSASTGLAGAGWPASANSVIAGTNKNLMPVTNSGASGGHLTPHPPRTTVSPGLVGNTGAASSPGTTGGLGTTVNAIVTSTPRPAGNASVTSISGTTVSPGTAGNTNVTSIPGVASSPGTAVVPRTAGNTSITSTPAPTSNPGATGNTSVTSTPGAAGSTSTASTTGGTSSPGAASNSGVTGKPGASGSPGTAGNPGAVGNTSVASNPVAAANPGAARGLGASGNSGSAGKPGAFGNNGIGGSRGAAGARPRGMSAGRSVGP